jgi:hypothetical protein
LFERGVTGLLELAAIDYDFTPAVGYLSKCHLCLDLRRYLVLDKGVTDAELRPQAFYENL